MTKYKVSFFFAWYDFWVGFYYDRKAKVLYICPLPCCVFKIKQNIIKKSLPKKQRILIEVDLVVVPSIVPGQVNTFLEFVGKNEDGK